MIRSGSHTPGVDSAAWGLPDHTALRIERPAPALRDLFAEYHVLDSDGPAIDGATSHALPNWPMLRVILAERPISLTLGPRRYDPLPEAALYGTTSRAMRVVSRGGVTIGVGVTPLGWSRLFAAPAEAFRDRVVPLAEVMDAGAVAALVAALRRSDRDLAVKGILDGFLAGRLRPPSADDAAIRALEAMVADEATTDIAGAAERAGIAPHTLRRLSRRYFGFPPKPLLVRARFLRALTRMMAEGIDGYDRLPPGYHDLSHFLRDARRFLGTTPLRFARLSNAFVEAGLRARAAVRAAGAREDAAADPS